MGPDIAVGVRPSHIVERSMAKSVMLCHDTRRNTLDNDQHSTYHQPSSHQLGFLPWSFNCFFLSLNLEIGPMHGNPVRPSSAETTTSEEPFTSRVTAPTWRRCGWNFMLASYKYRPFMHENALPHALCMEIYQHSSQHSGLAEGSKLLAVVDALHSSGLTQNGRGH